MPAAPVISTCASPRSSPPTRPAISPSFKLRGLSLGFLCIQGLDDRRSEIGAFAFENKNAVIEDERVALALAENLDHALDLLQDLPDHAVALFAQRVARQPVEVLELLDLLVDDDLLVVLGLRRQKLHLVLQLLDLGDHLVALGLLGRALGLERLVEVLRLVVLVKNARQGPGADLLYREGP